ncbi:MULTISPECIES: branched-chain amino acid ABC transporter permease [Comamonadaceae]|uniref:branched-chain amino acid ABC transporter permease n=1 Tax=Comamonadaceae TaxID=80864 RepID=UPI00201D3D40|nr:MULTISPECIES: branched-chain amino acid ABC transporter permease [Comamonadaceae]
MLTTVLIGLSIGAVLLLVAAGLALAFGMLGVVNFAHGTLYMLGAFVAAEVVARSGSFVAGLLIAPLVIAALAVAIEALLLRPLYEQSHEKQLLLTFGLLILLEEVARAIWGLNYRHIQIPGFLSGQMEVLGEKLPVYRVFVIAAGALVAAVLVLMIDRTRIGMVLRAAMTHAQMVRGLGISIARYRTTVFALGGALAGLGGVIAAPLSPVQVNMGGTVILDSFMVVIVGGLGNVRGAVAAAFALGLLRAFGQQYAVEYVDLLTYVLLVIVLLLRPQGLFNSPGARKA